MQEQILAGRETIFSGWLKSLRDQMPATRDRADDLLIDGLDSVLKIAGVTIDRSDRRGSYAEVRDEARAHGERRAGVAGYDVALIVMEYTLLREHLLAFLEARGVAVSREADRALSRVFEAAIGTATEGFVSIALGASAAPRPECLAAILSDRSVSPSPEVSAGIDAPERALEEQRAQVAANDQLARFVAQSPLPMALMLGPRHTFVMVNAPYEKFIARESLGRTIYEIFTDEELADFAENIRRTYRTGTPFIANEYPLRRLDARGVMRAYMMNLAYHPFRDRDGNVIGVLAFMNDVTPEVNARRRAQESTRRLRAVFAHAAVGFSVTTLEGEFIESNPRFCELVGFDAEALLAMRFSDLIPPEDHDRDDVMMRDLETGRRPDFVIEKMMLRRGGEPIWVRNSVSLIPGLGGRPLVFRVSEDVTLLREADRRRRESEERYEKLADSMPQIVWTADAAGHFDYFNAKWFDYSGAARTDREGWLKAIHPDDAGATMKTWVDSVETGARYDREFRLRDRRGDFRWHVTRAVPAVDPDGSVEQWFGTCTDIHAAKSLNTDLERAQRDLETEQLKFRTIFAQSSAAMAVLQGPDLVFEIINASFAALFPNRDVVGLKFTEALPEIRDQAYPQLARDVFLTGHPYVDREARTELQRTEGAALEECFFDQTYTRMDDALGKPYGVFIQAREVTDLVRARREIEENAERFRIAVETADMGTWDIDPETSTLRWSERAATFFGLPGILEMPMANALLRVHPDDRRRVSAGVAAALDPAGSGDYSIEYRTLLANEEVRWISVLGKAFFSNTATGRRATRFTGVMLDVTGRMMADIALRDAKERAELASAAKSAFLANMSHEIRTPLGAIMGFVGLMREDNVERQAMLDYLTVIERNSVQLMRIIDDILDLSKVEAGMMLIEHIDFSLVEVLMDFASLMQFRAREKGIAFELKARTELPDLVKADPVRIRQILTNVVGNAIKFTEQGSVHLYVSHREGLIEFEVVDTGRGITSDQAQILFQPFSQADASTTRKYGGTGLGLVLTRRLSEAMGGAFVLRDSDPGRGSTFVSTVRVEVPTTAQMVSALGFAPDVVRGATSQGQLHGLEVLLVENSPDNQALFSIYLKRAGANIAIAPDGARGVEMAMAPNAYDVVLMDVQMPVMDGVTAVKTLRANGFRKPIIALTAHAMKEERARCLSVGCSDFLSKPVGRGQLIDTLLKYSPSVT